MKTNTTKEKDTMSDMADTAMKNYEQAVRTGLKLQEEAGKCWTSMLNQATYSQDWQKQFTQMTGVANNLMPLAQQRMEDFMALLEKNGHASTELMKKAVEAAQTPGLAESQTKWMEFWTASLGAVRSNAEAVGEMSSKAIDSWIDFVRKTSDGAQTRARTA
ncbi:MAG TPA: hypothetical protein VG146_01445 [Verrucomicrobiae bacterium]|nr:hypothetical protein [Verrucomicrobiae bacterium]